MENIIKVETFDGEYLIPVGTVNAITALTNNEEETNELLGYLMDRIAYYNDTLDLETDSVGVDRKFGYSSAFVKNLFINLLSLGFSSDQIITALDQYKDYELFGLIQNENGNFYDISLEERIEMIVNNTKLYLGLVSDEEENEENLYTNIEEEDIRKRG